ncbi:unnamed protein product [Adineta steineri]|uniref:LRAT domain-containing protein n=1 Tax=Adineta steineri TaxID=433720 RepID=A0A815QDT2_9BILA|nr:unnamed protein product [Adineta steineri]
MSIFHTIAPKNIWLGDHLYIWSSPFHQHHGIVIFVDKNDPDESQVLEFNTHDGSHKVSRARIQVVTLKRFRRDYKLKRVVYGSRYARFKRAGTAYKTQCLASEIVVDNAQLIIEQIKYGDCFIVPNNPTTLWNAEEAHGYNLILRNCECLAYWCKTGRWFSEQVIQLVENVGKYLFAMIKAIVNSLVHAGFIPSIRQELLSEMIETILPSCASKFCTILNDGIGNAIAFIAIEAIKLSFRISQRYHNQITWQEFCNQTLVSVVKSFTIGVFAFAIQALLTYLTFGTALAIVPWIGGFLGSLIGSVVGDFLGRLVVNGVAQINDLLFAD